MGAAVARHEVVGRVDHCYLTLGLCQRRADAPCAKQKEGGQFSPLPPQAEAGYLIIVHSL